MVWILLTRVAVRLLLLALTGAPGWSAAAAQAGGAQTTIEKGVVIPKVTCAEKPEQSYALYLPSNYTPERRWPVIFTFDPVGAGRVPVSMLKEAAEKYGYIVAGSNNSRNGPVNPQREAAHWIMNDVGARLAVDEKRIYTTGFSGGSRAATTVALLCQCVAGVIGHGAAFPMNMKPSKEVNFAYFGTVGDTDFNHPEMVDLRDQLDKRGVPNRLRRFSGPHSWPPPEVWMEAVEWLELRAMAEGRRPKYEGFIAQQHAQALEKLSALEQAGDFYAAWDEAHRAARDFSGLADAGRFFERSKELKDSAAVRDGRKREKKEGERQAAMTRDFFSAMQELLAGSGERPDVLARVYTAVAELRRWQDKAKDEAESRVAQRAVQQAAAFSFEAGDEALFRKNTVAATACYEIARELGPRFPATYIALARVYASTGKKKQALEALRQAVEKGLRNPAILRDSPEFAGLQQDPEFRAILESLPGPAARP